MQRHFLALCLTATATVAVADKVGVPAGCTVAATLVQGDCEMHQVLSCDGGRPGPTRVDVYGDDVFLREEAYATLTMVYWRYGKLVQELELKGGSFDHVASMPADEVREVTVTRIRRQIGAKGGPPPEDFDYTITVEGPAVRDLPGGGNREVRRYRVLATGAGEEGSDLRIDYDPAIGVPIWREGVVTEPDGRPVRVNLGVSSVLLPGDPGFMEGRAPDGAACDPG